PRYVYVGRSRAVRPAYTSRSGYVHYQRDRNADLFALSESDNSGYGNAARGVYCDARGKPVLDRKTHQPAIGRRRPRDTAWVTTSRYKLRYDGRWLMTQIRISPDGGHTYGPDLVDRWKARAFQQDRESDTPCCGYEEEDSNWGGSSILMGERCGPVRCIRETWGADSATNAVRRETFYRDEMRVTTYLRLHPVPPLDGIYAQWDFNAGRMTRFYSPDHPDGLLVDGINDDGFGNFDDPCNPKYDGNSTSVFDQTYRSTYRAAGLCSVLPYHQSVDVADPRFGPMNAGLDWTQTSGPWGTIVDRFTAKLDPVSPGGIAQQLVALPYYRDDSCFDDGTGVDPGPRLWIPATHYRAEPDRAPSDGKKRRCWTVRDGPLTSRDDHFYQGSIGTHGVHLLLIADSDNARQTIPLTEIDNEQRLVLLPGNPGNVGEQYGRGFERPLLATVSAP
ncbi:MAG: hypothetical protein LC640_06470, partial [Frankia sp.]|nr:hypothetical protein [Frankia sp.]